MAEIVVMSESQPGGIAHHPPGVCPARDEV